MEEKLEVKKNEERIAGKVPTKTTWITRRPKPAYSWSINDVQKWFSRHCGEYDKYADIFLRHEINGQALLRITDITLLRMGIEDNKDREAIWREIIKQRLKTDIVDFRDLESMNAHYNL